MSQGPDDTGGRLIWIPRVVFLPARTVSAAVGYPIRSGLYAYEKYEVKERLISIFYNDDRTFGLYPMIGLDDAFIPSDTFLRPGVGARLVVQNLGGNRFRLRGYTNYAGSYRQSHRLQLSTGETWDHFELLLRLEALRRARDPLWGIGNGEEADVVPAGPVDPVDADLWRTRFQQQLVRTSSSAVFHPGSYISLQLTGALTRRRLAESREASEAERVEDVFLVDDLTGFGDEVNEAYGEVELRRDTRRGDRWAGAATPTSGYLLRSFLGYAAGLGGASGNYARTGGEAQVYFGVAPGPRVLVARFYADAVIGSFSQIPFSALPRLGGATLLRGYDRDRFRDKGAALGSLEYQFDLSTEYASGFVFVDAGRVYRSPRKLTLNDMRVGFGGGVELHSRSRYLSRVTIASSIDGGLITSLSVSPIYDLPSRVHGR